MTACSGRGPKEPEDCSPFLWAPSLASPQRYVLKMSGALVNMHVWFAFEARRIWSHLGVGRVIGDARRPPVLWA